MKNLFKYLVIFFLYCGSIHSHHPGNTVEVGEPYPEIFISIYEDSYDGAYTDRRVLMYTLTFTAKMYLYGPVTSSKIIKTVQVDQYTDMPSAAPKREQRYTATPNPTSADADDDFGFNETTSFYQDAKNYNTETGEDE